MTDTANVKQSPFTRGSNHFSTAVDKERYESLISRRAEIQEKFDSQMEDLNREIDELEREVDNTNQTLADHGKLIDDEDYATDEVDQEVAEHDKPINDVAQIIADADRRADEESSHILDLCRRYFRENGETARMLAKMKRRREREAHKTNTIDACRSDSPRMTMDEFAAMIARSDQENAERGQRILDAERKIVDAEQRIAVAKRRVAHAEREVADEAEFAQILAESDQSLVGKQRRITDADLAEAKSHLIEVEADLRMAESDLVGFKKDRKFAEVRCSRGDLYRTIAACSEIAKPTFSGRRDGVVRYGIFRAWAEEVRVRQSPLSQHCLLVKPLMSDYGANIGADVEMIQGTQRKDPEVFRLFRILYGCSVAVADRLQWDGIQPVLDVLNAVANLKLEPASEGQIDWASPEATAHLEPFLAHLIPDNYLSAETENS